VKLLVAQLCPTLYDPMDYSSLVSSVYGIFQTRILKWVAIPISRDLPDAGIEPRSPVLQADSLCLNHQGSPKVQEVRDGMGREVGGGFRMGNTCIPMADSC